MRNLPSILLVQFPSKQKPTLLRPVWHTLGFSLKRRTISTYCAVTKTCGQCRGQSSGGVPTPERSITRITYTLSSRTPSISSLSCTTIGSRRKKRSLASDTAIDPVLGGRHLDPLCQNATRHLFGRIWCENIGQIGDNGKNANSGCGDPARDLQDQKAPSRQTGLSSCIQMKESTSSRNVPGAI